MRYDEMPPHEYSKLQKGLLDNWKECKHVYHFCHGIYPESKPTFNTYFDNFTYQGNTYLFNTVVKLNEVGVRHLGTEGCYTQVVQHYLNQFGIKQWTYVARIDGNTIYKASTTVPIEELVEEVTIPAVLVKRKPQKYSDFEVPEVLLGWAIYIVVMLFSLVFVDFIVIWVLASIVFFKWRANKLKKPENTSDGHYYGI